MNILFTNDWHFAKTNPTSRVDDYNAELFGLLEQLAILVKHFQCEALCLAGDIFHNKGLAPWDVVIKLLAWGRQLPCEIFTISGNHDQQHDRYESIGQTPYGVLIGSGIFTDISRRAVQVGGDHGPVIYGVPWPDAAKPDAFKVIPDGVDIVMAHGFATSEGIERWGVFCHKYDDLVTASPRVRLWHFGHDHTDHGVFRLRNGAAVINIGALARGALDQDTLARQVKAAVVCNVQTASPDVMQIALKTKPVEEIFDLTRYRERRAEQQHLDAFLDELQRGLSNVLDVDYETLLGTMPLDDAVRARVRQYIEQAEAVG